MRPAPAAGPWSETVDDDRPACGAPLVAHWAVTYRCNLRCAFCYAESGPGAAGADAPRPAPIVERLADWGVLEVALGGGEPTVLPDFPASWPRSGPRGMVPNVTTNGTVHRAEVLAPWRSTPAWSTSRPTGPTCSTPPAAPGVFDRLRQTAPRPDRGRRRLGVNLLLTPDNVRDLGRSLRGSGGLGAGASRCCGPRGTGRRRAGRVSRRGDLDARPKRPRSSSRAARRAALRGYGPAREWSASGCWPTPSRKCWAAAAVSGMSPSPRRGTSTPARTPAAGYRMGNLLTDDLERLWAKGPGRASRLRYLCDCRGAECPCRVGVE